MRGNTIWQGKPSQWMNLKTYLFCAATFWLIVPIWYAYKTYRKTKHTHYLASTFCVSVHYPYQQSKNRLIELSRVESIEIICPPLYKYLDLCDLVVRHQKRNIPPVVFHAIHNAQDLRDELNMVIEESQKEQKVQEIHLPILQ